MISVKKKVIILIVSLLLISGITLAAGAVSAAVSYPWLRLLLSCLLNIANGAVALIAMRLSGIKTDFGFNNYRQYLIGAGIAAGLSLLIAVIPAVCGFSLVGPHIDFVPWRFAYEFFFYLVIIGPVEELIFRIYVQDVFTSFFTGCKWLGVLIAAALFGLWHLINGSFIQVLFTFFIGAVWGLSRYFIKNLKYPGLAMSHGLYDFLNIVVRMFIVR